MSPSIAALIADRLPLNVIVTSDVPSPLENVKPVVRRRLKLPKFNFRLTSTIAEPASGSAIRIRSVPENEKLIPSVICTIAGTTI